MKVGMLWYDAQSKDDLPTRISHASEYYQKKYGSKPNLCFLNPLTAGLDPGADTTSEEGIDFTSTQGIRVELSVIVLPGHFWIGVENARASQAG